MVCNNLNKLKEKQKQENETAISQESIKDSNTKEIQINQNSETYQNQTEQSGKSFDCIFKRGGNLLPRIRESIGDKINIKKTNDWLLSLEMTDEDSEIRKVINQGEKHLQQ
ncbi:MAG: hypothetical protein ACI8P3_002368 [Saprospiraceae bacterium]|jgi:hypothetical protein